MAETTATPPNSLYEHLKKVRASKTVTLKPTPMLRTEIVGLDGTPQPLCLRYYQCQGIYHLLVVNRMVLGDATGTGKTLSTIGALCYLWERKPDYKILVVCPKSAIRQWASEVARFTSGVTTFLATGSAAERKKAYEGWRTCSGPAMVITNYHGLVREWGAGALPGKPGYLEGLTKDLSFGVILDEVTAVKNPSTKTHQTCRFLADRASRVYGLTATLLKNNLMEGFGIFKVVKPDLFTTKTKFQEQYCVLEMQRVYGGGKVPIVVGYKNLGLFRETIAPYFYGRTKQEVSTELPSLTTREVLCPLSSTEDEKYGEALSGVLELGDGDLRDFQDTKALTSLIYCQQVVNSLTLLNYEDGGGPDEGSLGAKEQALIDLLTEEFDDDKIIVYTRFESLVSRLQKLLGKHKVKSVRITGKENANVRKVSQDKFQDLKSDVRVVFITDAGSEAINLQAAAGMIFYDAPWSWGNYVQLLGRMTRIGSPHASVYAIHLVAERLGKKKETIDHAVVRALRRKKSMIDQVIGEAAVGALTFDRGEGALRELYDDVRANAV